LTFRGLGYSLLEQHGFWVAGIVSALGWSLAHGLVSGVPIFLVFGLALAWLRRRTASVVPGILVHGLFNTAALIQAVA
jgi:membrane protease YdiL (CAAX protease family)